MVSIALLLNRTSTSPSLPHQLPNIDKGPQITSPNQIHSHCLWTMLYLLETCEAFVSLHVHYLESRPHENKKLFILGQKSGRKC